MIMTLTIAQASTLLISLFHVVPQRTNLLTLTSPTLHTIFDGRTVAR